MKVKYAIRRYAGLGWFPLLSLILVTAIAANNQHVFNNPESSMRVYLKSLTRGNAGFGLQGYYKNDISFAGLEEGDILLGGYPHCAYGRFSHAAMYIGNGQVIECYIDLGVTVQPIIHYRDYSEVCLLRVKADPAIKRKAVDYIKKNQGGMFYTLAFKSGDRIWNCTKIIWRAYYEQGLDLDQAGDFWVTPDSFYYSCYTEVIREKGR